MMISSKMPWSMAAIMLALLCFQSWRLASIQGDVIRQKDSQIAENYSRLIDMASVANSGNLAQAALRTQLNEAEHLSARRKDVIKDLYRENKDYRQWADKPLPDDVIRMQQRPALSGAAAYRRWLSDANRLPISSPDPAE